MAHRAELIPSAVPGPRVVRRVRRTLAARVPLLQRVDECQRVGR